MNRMLKSFLLLGIIVFLPLVSFAEPGFTLEVLDATHVDCDTNVIVEFHMILTNTGDTLDSLKLSLVDEDVPEDWVTSMCFGGFCRPSFIRSSENPLDAGAADSTMSVDFNVGDLEGSGNVWFFVRSNNDTTIVDSVNFSVYAGENDVADNNEQIQPTEFGLTSVYPNPFNSTTLVNYTLPLNSQVKLKVYSMLGQEISTLYEGMETAGTHQVSFSALPIMSSGIYLIKLETEQQISLARALYIK